MMQDAQHFASTASNRSALHRSLLQRRRGTIQNFTGNREPTLGELLADPILLRLLVSDGVGKEHLAGFIAEMQNRLREARL
jgi:hypothetical protein